MACRKNYQPTIITKDEIKVFQDNITEPTVIENVYRLLFGVDSSIQSDDILQNNIDLFEWITRNKIYPNFYGRNIVGENSLTKEEIKFIHNKGCAIAAIYKSSDEKKTMDQGIRVAKEIEKRARELGIPEGTAIFLDVGENENVNRDFMRGYTTAMILEGYTPSFKANTDAKYDFDREFSSAMQLDKDSMKKCLIWAIAPTVKEYDGMTTSHLIHPDNWLPYAPSCLRRKEIAIWQYGKNCHPIEDDTGKIITFNLNLVRNEQIIVDKMF